MTASELIERLQKMDADAVATVAYEGVRAWTQEPKGDVMFKFPDVPRQVEFGATRWQIWRTRTYMWFVTLLNRFGLPGAIADTEIDDEGSGLRIAVRTSVFGTTICVNGRDFVFSRFRGRFCGTGQTICHLPAPPYQVKKAAPILKA